MAFSLPNAKALSVYGGAGGHGIHISPIKPRSPVISGNEKAIMKNLNDRLAAYMQKVNILQSENDELEKKIMEWCASHTVDSRDYSGYLDTIKSLQDQILHITNYNCATEIHIKNACLVADDLRSKYEIEQYIRMWIETDTAHSRKIMDEITLVRSTLEQEYESLREERIRLEMSHEEEIGEMSEQAGFQVDVCVDAAPSTDLSETLGKIREQYEAAGDKHHKDLEAWYQRQTSQIEKNRLEETEDSRNGTKQLRQSDSYFRRLQIELEAQHSTVTFLRESLQHTENLYAEKLSDLNGIIAERSVELQQIRTDMAQTKQEYDVLLEVNNNLETEITEYRLLLEEKDRDPKAAPKKITVVKVVESCESMTTN